MSSLERIGSIADLRSIAQRRLPQAVFDFVDGAAEDEITLAANAADLARIAFLPRYLVNVDSRDLTVDILGRKAGMPLLVAPTGLAALVSPNADCAIARAAAAAGIPFTISSSSSVRMENIRAQAPDARLWFQVYVYRDRELVERLVARARAIDVEALVLTIDVPILGHRHRDFRNGFTVPLRPGARLLFDCVRCLPWALGILRHGVPKMQNFVDSGHAADIASLAALMTRNMDASLDWSGLAWLRRLWKGPLVLKGVLSAHDATKAIDHGVDALWISNHGGRQLDGMASTVSVLESIVAAAAGRTEIYIDGGIRNGRDISRVIAMGARAGAIGRPVLYGAAAGGFAGVQRTLAILRAEHDRSLALLGCPASRDLDRRYLRN